MSVITNQKRLLRSQLRDRLQNIDAGLQSRLQNEVKAWLLGQKGVWGGFIALPGEPDLSPLWQTLPNLSWAFPRIDQENLVFHESPGSQWVPGPFGILEPAMTCPKVSLEKIQGLLIPGLGFDRKGRRLGRGKGFYDRLLANWRGLKVGVCFESQWIDQAPVEAHDQKMDLILTEEGLFKP